MDTAAFLRRIGLTRHDGPSVEALFELHAAFADTVPYESVQYQLGKGGPLEPSAVAERILAREAGGYCFQLNGVFAQFLTELGYQVTMHRGGVQTMTRPARVDASHLVLTVHGLDDDPQKAWLVDVGLGDGLFTPMPLEAGTARQAPFELRLRPSEIVDGWRLDHDPRSTLAGMDFESAPATLAAFEDRHAYLSVAPDSPFLRLCAAYRRKAGSVVILRSLSLIETFDDRIDSTLLETPADFYTALNDIFGLPCSHLSPAERDQIFARALAQYEGWLATQNAN